jgi:sensor histidine kinase regulating citrate/malate metabolism
LGGAIIHIENTGKELLEHEVQHMLTVGHSTKADHLGLGVPLAHFGIQLAGGELFLRQRMGGGLHAYVHLPLASDAPIRVLSFNKEKGK